MAWCVKGVGGVGFVLFRLFVLLTAGVRVLSRCFKVVVAQGLRAAVVYNYGGGAWDILLMTRSTGRPMELVCVIKSFHSLIIVTEFRLMQSDVAPNVVQRNKVYAVFWF